MSSHSHNNHSSAGLVHKLVCHILKQPPDNVKQQYRTALQSLNTSFSSYPCDESTVADKIKRKFVLEKKESDAKTFADLLRKLQTSVVLKNRLSVLQFLNSLYGASKESDAVLLDSSSKLSLLNPNLDLKANDIVEKISNKKLSGIVDFGADFLKNYNHDDYPNGNNSHKIHHKKEVHLQSKAARIRSLLSNTEEHDTFEKVLSTRSDNSNLCSVSSVSSLKPLLRDLLYTLQGLKGEILHWEPEKRNFNVIFREDFPNTTKKYVLRFMELGWMYCKVNNFCGTQKRHSDNGLVAQSLVAALRAKLTDYYKLIAELEAMLTQEITLENMYSSSIALTLHKLSVWLFQPHLELKILCSVVDSCIGKKGGAVLSVLYSHLQHGNPSIRNLMQNLLQQVSHPFFKILSYWIYCGELDDKFGEFFVHSMSSITDAELWQRKYILNKAMIPTFLTKAQAKKILSTGKSINFLHHVCEDNTFVRDESRRIKALELMNTDSLFLQDKDSNFEDILEQNYIKTSKVVLEVLYDKYSLMNHLYAMRNYFFLGQGDFIHHLMDLLDHDLSKPAKKIRLQNLSSFLESAIRSTNAQFHQADILQRLDFALLETSTINDDSDLHSKNSDTGWDIMTFVYHIDGPLRTIFTDNIMRKYQRIFAVLWKVKRMEFILNKVSQSRTYYIQLQEKVPEVRPIIYECHSLLAQMVHFILQMQYYMAFEVMECCWSELLQKISSAQDLDEVITAHNTFLNLVIDRALFQNSTEILNGLKPIYDQILEFDTLQSHFWASVRYAVEKLDAMQELIESNTNSSGWGLTERQRIEHMEPLNRLRSKIIPDTKVKLHTITYQYEKFVQNLLILLNQGNDENLHYLSFRLDFNEHFKKKNIKLQTSLTYQNRRKSIKWKCDTDDKQIQFFLVRQLLVL